MQQARIAVVEVTYYQQVTEQPTSTETRFSRSLQSDELPYIRRMTVGEEWIPLDSGWLEGNVGMMILSNSEGKEQKVIPSEEEKRDREGRVIEIGVASSHMVMDPISTLYLPPGESLRVSPVSFSSLRTRCRKGTARLSLTLFPL